jgi:hypothetical protein
MPDSPSPKSRSRRERYERKTRRKRVNLSLSPADFRRLELARKEDGERTLAQFIRRLSLAALDGRQPAPANLQREISELRLEVRRIGGNLNQAVKLAQVFKDRQYRISGQPVDIEKELVETWRRVRELEAALAGFLDTRRP